MGAHPFGADALILEAMPEQLDEFRVALEEMPKPILAYCRSGTRCTMLWSITRFEDLGADEILRATAKAGYDMSGLVAQLERRQ